MAYIELNQLQLTDLSFSKEREILLVNRLGAYCSTSVSTCNTRKYHGLLVAPQPQIDDQSHVLLSGIDETIFSNDKGYGLAVHQYPGVHFPEGSRYMAAFSFEDIPKWIYKVDDITLEKQILLSPFENRVMIRYYVAGAKKKIKLHLRPFIACRNVHTVFRMVPETTVSADEVANGFRFKLFEPYEALHFQYSRKPIFKLAPDWYHNIEYEREKERGYEYQESLFQPGFFEFSLKEGEELICSCSTAEVNPRMLKKDFAKEKVPSFPRDSFDHCLFNAAEQFLVKHNDGMKVIAGWPWFGSWGRDTFIALPGLTLATGKPEVFKLVINTIMTEMKDGLFPNTGTGEHAEFNSVDAPLWCIWALQQLAWYQNDSGSVWRQYGEQIKTILDSYKRGTRFMIKAEENGLISAREGNYALTWMDAVTDGYPVTGRQGMAVEINALWYNAVCFALEAAEAFADTQFIDQWSSYPAQLRSSFTATFWNDTKGYLADYVDENHQDWSIRPNQIFAVSLPYSPVTEGMASVILDTVERELLTPRGLRSLAPSDPAYQGTYFGDQYARDKGYHQGTVWPWLMTPFAEAHLKINGADSVGFAEQLYNGFEPAITEYGLGTIAEVYNGDAPHKPGGTIAQAWSVAELLRLKLLIAAYKTAAPEKGQRVTSVRSTSLGIKAGV